jgi:hypothetical protein
VAVAVSLGVRLWVSEGVLEPEEVPVGLGVPVCEALNVSLGLWLGVCDNVCVSEEEQLCVWDCVKLGVPEMVGVCVTLLDWLCVPVIDSLPLLLGLSVSDGVCVWLDDCEVV